MFFTSFELHKWYQIAQRITNIHLLDVRQIQQAEKYIIKQVQSKHFGEEINKLRMKKKGSKEVEISTAARLTIYTLI